MPGRIETYDYTNRSVTVQPLLKKVFTEGESLEYKILANVPVIFPSSQESGMTFPLNRGDGVLILFSERALERWKSNGALTEPGDSRKFDLSDGICIPGLFAFNQKPLAENNKDVFIKHKNQKIVIKNNGNIEIGSSSLQKLVNESFMNLFNSHTHTYIPAIHPAVTPVPSGAASPQMTLNNLTSKTKAQ